MARYQFSVIMAIYNVQEYIDEAMESIINQTIGFDQVQVIMVDDCSTDDSADICQKYQDLYPNNVVFIRKTENSGAKRYEKQGNRIYSRRTDNFN